MRPASDTDELVSGLIAYVDASPTPFHAVAQAAALLDQGGFEQVEEADEWPCGPGRRYLTRGGSLLAWVEPEGALPHTPFRVVGAHTDSPNLRIKPQPDVVKAGWQGLGVEPYGGLLRNSWLDRDLGLAGRVAVRDGSGVRTELFHDNRPLLRVPQLAPHLDRGVNDRGLQLNPQQHLVPIWSRGEAAGFAAYLAGQVGCDAGDILAWDAMCHDTQPSARTGVEGEFVSAPRLDNLASSYAAVRALTAGEPTGYRQVIALFDHEEIGSASERGAQSPILATLLERVVLAAGGSRDDYWRALAGSTVASADMAHATHPNYADYHEPQHHIAMNGGPVLKVQTEMKYATDAVGAGVLALACEQADVPLQRFVVRSDIQCGSTIGPITAARVGVRTVDLGAPLLAMHSIRELAGAHDQMMYAACLAAFLAPA